MDENVPHPDDLALGNLRMTRDELVRESGGGLADHLNESSQGQQTQLVTFQLIESPRAQVFDRLLRVLDHLLQSDARVMLRHRTSGRCSALALARVPSTRAL